MRPPEDWRTERLPRNPESGRSRNEGDVLGGAAPEEREREAEERARGAEEARTAAEGRTC